MTDRELLEAAARVAGIEIQGWFGDDETGEWWVDIGPEDVIAWNALTDDGDRYRLAKRLGINIDFSDCCAWKRLPDGELIQEWWGGESGDEAQAVVRAAAAIGEKMIDALPR
jgi:hypothetical protein